MVNHVYWILGYEDMHNDDIYIYIYIYKIANYQSAEYQYVTIESILEFDVLWVLQVVEGSH